MREQTTLCAFLPSLPDLVVVLLLMALLHTKYAAHSLENQKLWLSCMHIHLARAINTSDASFSSAMWNATQDTSAYWCSCLATWLKLKTCRGFLSPPITGFLLSICSVVLCDVCCKLPTACCKPPIQYRVHCKLPTACFLLSVSCHRPAITSPVLHPLPRHILQPTPCL